MSSLQAIRYDSSCNHLAILDQLKLPYESVYVDVCNVQDGYNAIKTMAVRGAPAIAIVGALSLAVELAQKRKTFTNAHKVVTYVQERLDYLVESRPTAVNLSLAAKQLNELASGHDVEAMSSDQLIDVLIDAAEQMLKNDVKDNKQIGSNGYTWIKEELKLDPNEMISAVTICNTGSLATAGYGTALGIIRSLYSNNLLNHAYCLETRPYNQGSRLTAYELVHDGIPSTLITDSMASSLLRKHSEIKVIVVGADRVAKNGDTANKIGTYQLAVVARHHGVKFVVAAPTTTIDLDTVNGEDIVIEQRPAKELTQVKGAVVSDIGTIETDKTATISIAAPGIGIWNPSFDVTPKDLIDAIVTEKGVAVKNEQGEFNLNALFN